MNPQILAILTIFIIGIIAFLIGYFANQMKLKNQLEKTYAQNKALAQRNQRLIEQSNTYKQEGEVAAKLINEANIENQQLQEDNEQLKIERSNLEKECRRLQEQTNPKKMERLLDALGKEKQERVLLLAELNELKSLHMGSKAVKEVNEKKVSLKYRLTNIFQRIGLRSTNGEDDLLKIEGLPASLSSKLNKIGIFNYKQLGLLEDKDIPTIAEAIGVEPEKINQNNWINQARQLYKVKYSS